MAVLWNTVILLFFCGVTLVASRGHHMRHRHGLHHLKRHLHRLHLNRLKEKLLSTVMPTTFAPRYQKFVLTEAPKIETTTVIKAPETTTRAPLNQVIELTKIPEPKPTKVEVKEKPLLQTVPDEEYSKLKTEKLDIKETTKPKKQEKLISYEELKKQLKYDDKSTLPILDEPMFDDMDDAKDTNETGPQPASFRPVAMPKRFVSYDKNRDGFISMKELQKVTGAVENSGKAFKDTDKNNDGYISPEEFMSAPWVLEDDPDQNAKLEETRTYLKSRMESLDDVKPLEDEDLSEEGNVYAGDWYPLNDD